MAESSTQGQMKRTRRELARRADVWKNFILFEDNHENKKARCKHCGVVLNASQGTSSPRKHIRVCSALKVSQQPPLPTPCAPPRPGGSSDCCEPSLEEASKHLARMIALRGFDPSIVEDDCFRVRCLNPVFEVPSRIAIEEMCDGIFDEAREDSFSRLRCAPGRVSFAVDKAKTIVAGEATYIARHFIDDKWNLHKFVLHAPLDDADAEHDFRDGPILGFDVVAIADEDVMQAISGHQDRLSVVAYDITDKDLHPLLKYYIGKIESHTNLSRTTTTYVDNVLHSIAGWLLPDTDFTDDMFEDMFQLDLTRQERLQLLSELDLHYEWAYDKSWCACYFSLQVLRKRGFTTLVYADLFVKLVCKIWEQVYRGIQRISASTSPTSNLCLVELFKLRDILQAELAPVSHYQADTGKCGYEHFGHDSAVNVLRKACGTLDMAIQDWYLVWSVPLALDPRYKLRYIDYRFQKAYTASEAAKYVTDVTTNINKLYVDYTKEYGTTTDAEHSDSGSAMMDTTRDPSDQA